MKLYLLYYKCILDRVVEQFVDQFKDAFSNQDGKYVIGLDKPKSTMVSMFSQLVDECTDSIVESIQAFSQNDILVVIGSCYPKDNLLLEFKDDSFFPARLSKMLEDKSSIKWLMRESDIEIDISLFNELLIDIFNQRFNQRFNKSYKCSLQYKTLYVAHKRLDCYMMFKTLKWIFGNSNCINVWKECLSSDRQNLVALNDCISRYIHNKSQMNRSKDFKKCALEVRSFMQNKLGIDI